jgi:hypothetical protein
MVQPSLTRIGRCSVFDTLDAGSLRQRLLFSSLEILWLTHGL